MDETYGQACLADALTNPVLKLGAGYETSQRNGGISGWVCISWE